MTSLGAGFRYAPQWSPDSKKIAFIDQAMRIRIYDVASGKLTEVDQSPEWIGARPARGLQHPVVARLAMADLCAADGVRATTRSFSTTRRTAKLHQATTGYLNDAQPMFDPEGKYLFYASDRAFDPVYGSFDNSWTYPNPTQDRRRAAAQGRAVAARRAQRRRESADRSIQADKAEEDRREAEETTRSGASRKERRADTPAPANVDIDLDGFEARAVVLPPKAGNYADLQAIKGKVLYRRPPRTGSGDEKSAIVFFDLAEREEKTVLDDAGRVRGDGRRQEDARRAARTSSRSSRSRRRRSSRSRWSPADMEAPVDPRAEWRQMFADAFRFERDFFYDPNMHGVDWAGAARALRQAARRRGDALGCRLRARRVHRRAERVAHLSRRRRRGAGAAASRSACSAWTGSSPTAPTASRRSSAAARGTPPSGRRSTSRA